MGEDETLSMYVMEYESERLKFIKVHRKSINACKSFMESEMGVLGSA